MISNHATGKYRVFTLVMFQWLVIAIFFKCNLYKSGVLFEFYYKLFWFKSVMHPLLVKLFDIRPKRCLISTCGRVISIINIMDVDEETAEREIWVNVSFATPSSGRVLNKQSRYDQIQVSKSSCLLSFLH